MANATITQIIERYAQEAGKPDARFLRNPRSNVFVGSHFATEPSDTTIYSFGHHFPMAVIMASPESKRGWWLVNGDTVSSTTSAHQSALRKALEQTGLQTMTVPFSALSSAGIRQDTITPVEIRPDFNEKITVEWKPDTPGEAPPSWLSCLRTENGAWVYDTFIHHLGSSLFTASFEYYDRETRSYVRGSAAFLSAFDENEPGFGLYFLAQLPDWSNPATIEQAYEDMKPDAVKQAETAGVKVSRQGDVFAIPVDRTTRSLPAPTLKTQYVLGVNHQVSQARTENGMTYARGVMRHRPREAGRRPEHKQLRLGSAWHLLVRNTVPDGRSWSMSGKVD